MLLPVFIMTLITHLFAPVDTDLALTIQLIAAEIDKTYLYAHYRFRYASIK